MHDKEGLRNFDIIRHLFGFLKYTCSSVVLCDFIKNKKKSYRYLPVSLYKAIAPTGISFKTAPASLLNHESKAKQNKRPDNSSKMQILAKCHAGFVPSLSCHTRSFESLPSHGWFWKVNRSTCPRWNFLRFVSDCRNCSWSLFPYSPNNLMLTLARVSASSTSPVSILILYIVSIK